MPKRLASAAAVLAVVALGTPARAEVPRSALDLVPALSLPRLGHRGFSIETMWSIATGRTNDGRTIAFGVETMSIEMALIPGVFYAGFRYPVLAGLPASRPGRSVVVPGNPELFTRVVWTNAQGIAIGGALGFVQASPFSTTASEKDVVLGAGAVTPADFNLLRPHTGAVRGAVDAAVSAGPILLQLRHGLEYVAAPLALPQAQVASTTTAYVGVPLVHGISIGAEANQLYFFDSKVSDGARDSSLLQLDVSYTTRAWTLHAAAFRSVGDPPSPALGSIQGFRLGLEWTSR
jgi:hypothetical protein